MAIVACTDVVKKYHQGKVEVSALRGVTLDIDRGEFVALAGPSGSGKTTLLNMIGGLDRADSGRIVVDGNDYGAMTQGELAQLRLHKIGFVFQSYNLIPVLSALENVEYVMLLQGVAVKERRARARAILDEVGLGEMYDRRPAELSGGQQQRVAVARAIVAEPAIVLADEPTANLDSETGRGLLEMMLEMNEKKQVTFIFSTHEEMVMDHARRLVRIKDGRVAADRIKQGKGMAAGSYHENGTG
ncbi:MAG: ABC transporter ATP-binding protein [Desulfobacterales bacterium]|nr:ABC transporter ATP-binding protein [Desulfobacterales bacterium]